METIEQIKPTATAEAESYAEHKAARKTPPVVEEKKSAETKANTNVGDNAGGAEDSGKKSEVLSADTKNQETNKSAKKSAVPDRIKELTDARNKEREEKEALRRELEALKAAPKTDTKPEQKTEAAAPTAADESDKPRLKDFVAKLKGDETYEDAVERHADAVAEWREKRAEAKRTAAEAEKQQGTAKEQFAARVRAAQAKHADFEEVTHDLAPLMSPEMQRFAGQHPDGVEVAVHLGRNRDELEAIKKLTPIEQIGALGAIAARIKAPTQQTEKKQVSKAPAPPPRVGGSEAPPAKDTSEALTYAEHKRLRTQGR